MRRLIIASLITAIAGFANAQLASDTRVSPDAIRVYVGETVHATGHVILGCCSHFPWRISYQSNNEFVAHVEGLVEEPNISTDIRITGVALGNASIVSTFKGSGGWPLASIEVICPDSAVKTTTTLLAAQRGKPVTLTAVSSFVPSVVTWYLGRIGDVSHLLSVNGVQMAFTPDAHGTHYVWAKSASACEESRTEFVIYATRQRAVSR